MSAAATPARESFVFAQAGREVKVWYFQPPGITSQSPVVFVMHGVQRNGEDYLNEWIEAATAKKFLLVVPEFSKTQFPGEEGYIYGNTVDEAGRAMCRRLWRETLSSRGLPCVEIRGEWTQRTAVALSITPAMP